MNPLSLFLDSDRYRIYRVVRNGVSMLGLGVMMIVGGLAFRSMSAGYDPARDKHGGHGAMARQMSDMGDFGGIALWGGGLVIVLALLYVGGFFLNEKFDWF